MNWHVKLAPSDVDVCKESITLVLEQDTFPSIEDDILYKKYGFARDEENGVYTLDLDQILVESVSAAGLRETVNSLLRVIGELKDRLVELDGDRLKAAMALKLDGEKDDAEKA